MANRTYVELTNFDDTQSQFAFELESGNTYVKIGNLTTAAEDYIRTFTNDDRLGFIQRGIQKAHIGIANTWDETNERLPIDAQPEGLTLGESYRLWATRETVGTGTGVGRPGRDGRDGTDGGNPIHAVVEDGERRVIEVLGYTIGTGTTTETPSPFTFTWRDTDLTHQITEESQTEVTQIVDWQQGYPLIPNFNRTAITINFYTSESTTDPILQTDPEWFIGIDDTDSDPQPLSSVVRLGTLTDNGDNTGTLEVIFNTRLVDIMMNRNIYLELSVNQPNA